MKFKDLYDKGLDRKVNPAVSASDLTDETVLTEIVEYVFTEEIIINLYNILVNIKVNQGSHIGIWINGYYGSGKSHFLKYASYCLSQNKERCEMAFIRLIEATEDIMLHTKGISKLEQEGVSVSELKALQSWYVSQADVEMVMFNIGDVHDVNADQKTAFTTIFWNQFNAQRGYNSFNLALAQYLEKALDDNGKFQEFKDYVKSKGYDWERNISRFAAGRLDLALDMAKEVDPTLSTDVIRTRILNNDVNVSVESFAAEMKEYIDSKQNRNFRILFFVDEVSQFIGAHRDLLLQLQSLVKRLDEVCESRCWIACTAQQTLEEVVTNVGGNVSNPEDEVGKILGRFEVRASLQGTSPEYITQKRILDKKGDVEIKLGQMFDKDKAKLDAQFILPSQYKAYTSKEDFIACYPFVPYQFQLIMKVLDSFVNMNYVDKQVKGNERSLINITFSIAKETANMEVGEFISFDRFFGAMFQGSMQHLGQRALGNARQAISHIDDPQEQEFYRRVVYVLFMICNLSDVDKPTFSATIDNIVTLLMTKVDASKAAIKQEVSTVLAFLIDKAVIRKAKTETGSEIYEFYTEEESKVAQLISNQQVDSNTYSDELKTIFFSHFGNPSNKKTFATRSSISSDGFSARYCPHGALFDNGGSSLFSENNLYVIGGLVNSKVANRYFEFLAPTLNFQPGDVGNIAYSDKLNDLSTKERISELVQQNISISKSDWDSHETSWDFQGNELLTIDEQTYKENIYNFVEQHFVETGERLDIDSSLPDTYSLAWRVEQYKQKWEHKFMQLHKNEEELNRQFIDIYGLQDELTPDVPLDEITILQQGEISIEDNKIVWHDDVLMKQLISYAVGCMMGRYSIDHPGLILANQGDGVVEYEKLVPNSRFEVDDDGIIPLMSSMTDFADNATVRLKKWISVVFGEDTLVENLNFIEAALGKSLDDYFVKDFWKYHKKMYQNRPIYWLFSSKKGAFQCLAYMHRITPYTAEQIRTKYLLPHIEWLVQKQNELEANAANLDASERRDLDRLTAQITECREYHDRLHEVADEQIAFDLDDGVVVNYAKFGDVLQKIK